MKTLVTPSPYRLPSKGKMALLITLAIEGVFFATVLVAYIALRGQMTWDITHTPSRLAVPIFNTAILFASALTSRGAVSAIRRGGQLKLQQGLLATVLLGLLFVAGQWFEFNHAGLRVNDPSTGGVFFTLLTFHAVHVLAGMVFLLLNLIRANLGDFTASRHEAVVLGVWFWYFVTIVWMVLFLALYLL